MRIKLLIFSLLFSVLGWGQVWTYDFGTGTGTHPTNTISTTFLTSTPVGGGTYRVRTGTGGGTIVLANPGTTLGAGSELQIQSSTSASTNKFGVYDWNTPSTVAYLKGKIRNTSGTTGNLNISLGLNTIGSDSNGYTNHYNNSVASLTITYTAGAISAINRRISGSNVVVTGSGLAKDTDQSIEIYANNGAASTTYYTGGTTYTLNSQQWDLWIGGTKISPAGGWAKAGTLASGTNMSGFGFFAESSTTNSAFLYIDDLEYSNTLPPTPTYTMTYNGNGNDGGTAPVDGSSPYNSGSTVTVLGAGTLTRTGYTFSGWNTVFDGSGTSYAPAASFNISANTTLYAQWVSSSCTPPGDPSGTISTTQNCGSTALTYSAPTANLYWQTTTTGTDTTYPTTGLYSVNTSGTYYVRAYNGTCWSTGTASQAVTVLNPVIISTQPTTQTVTAPSTATFNVLATGSGLSYQWEVSTNAGGTWTPIGTNSNSYTTSATTIGMNGYLYHVIVSGTSPCSAVTSNNVTLTVNNPPCFSEDFASIVTGDNTTTGGSGTAWAGNTNFPVVSSAYNAGGAVKLGTGSLSGSITSKVLTGISGNVSVVFDVKGWTTVEGDIKVTLDGNVQTVTYTAVRTGSFETKSLSFTDIADGATLKIETTALRAFIDNVKIICGAPVPEINIKGNSVTIPDGSLTPNVGNHTDFGSTDITSGTIARTFTIYNVAAANLNIGAITIGGTHAADFTLTANPSAIVAPGGSTTFQVTFDPSAVGNRYATISIVNDDSNENPYDFSIMGTGAIIITNDLCANAINLTVNTAAIGGNMTGSTATAPFTKKDVWYKFTPTCSSTHAITVSGFTGDIDIELFSGSCPTTTAFLDNSNGTNSTETINIALTSGTTYYVRVLAYDVTAETSAFNIGVTAGSSLNISNMGSPATGNINTGANNVVIMGITTTPACATSYDVSSINLTKAAASTVAATDISNFRIFYDINGNGVIDGGEASVSGGGIALNNNMVFTLSGQTGIALERRYLLVADVSPTAVVGRKIKVDLTPSSNLVSTINPAGTQNGIALGNVQTIVANSCTPATITSVMPASGPVGTQVTITASSGSLVSATASFNGVAATVVSSSATQLVVVIPSGATTGNLIVTDTQPCSSIAIPFTIVDKDVTSCESSSLITDLFISEVTDASSGSLTYVEIYNGTSSSINMAALNYAVRFTNYNATLNDGAPGSDIDLPLSGTLVPGGKFIFGTTVGTACSVPGGNGSLANQSGVHSGINNNDLVKLVKGGTVIDVWGFSDDTRFWITDLGLGDRGYDFERKNTVSAPSTTFSSNDWTIIDWDSCSDDYSNIATYIPVVATPVITVQPTISVSCTTTSATLTVTANEGYVGGNPLAYQWYVVAPNTAAWSVVTDGGIYSGATTNNLAISSVATLDGYQFYCQVRENSATCYIASNAVLVSVPSTVWNGTIWTKGAPDTTKIAIVNGNYDTAVNGDFECCSLFVNTGYTLTIKDGDYVTVVNNITNNGTLTIENNGSLVQVDDTGVNTGNINMQRIAFVDYRDYVYWSTPVANFNSANISTFSNNSNLYKWIPTVSGNGVGDFGNWTSGVETMVLGKGYIERGLNNAPLNSPVNFTSTFTGVPNNGIITTPISRGTYNTVGSYPSPYSPTNATQDDDNWNLLGNPYPSSISADAFLTANSSNLDGFVKIWLHGIAPSTTASDPFYNNYSYNYDPNDYLTYNLSGPSTPGVFDGYIGAGQGFITRMSATSASTSTNAVFNNSMRSKTYRNDQFYRNTNNNVNALPQGRIWIDLVSATASSSTLIAYVNGATNGKDQMYDAQANLKANFSIYSLLEGYDRHIIQGRSLPFDQNDQVPLAIKISSNGNYTIAIKDVDGFFSDSNQSIYLEDKQTNFIHDLRSAPYYFTSTSGEFTDRFVLRYTNQTLGNDQFEVSDNSVKIYASDNSIVINSFIEPIKAYEIYNVLGKTLVSKKQVKINKAQETSLQKGNQVLIVKVTLENGKSFTKKVIY